MLPQPTHRPPTARKARSRLPLVELVETTASNTANRLPLVELVETTASKAGSRLPLVELVETTASNTGSRVPLVELVETTATKAPDGPRAIKRPRNELDKPSSTGDGSPRTTPHRFGDGRRIPWTYIVECRDGTFYVGSTYDLERRISEHNLGFGAKYTRPRRRRPVRLVWASEFNRMDEAFWYEKQIQGWGREKRVALSEGKLDLLTELAKNRQADRVDVPDAIRELEEPG